MTSGSLERLAGAMQIVGREVVAVEIDAGVTVHLKIDILPMQSSHLFRSSSEAESRSRKSAQVSRE